MVIRALMALAAGLALSGCGLQQSSIFDRFRGGQDAGPAASAPSEGEPLSALSTPPPPPPGAATAEAFDTTTAEERQAALEGAEKMSGERFLGETVTSLGDPAEPGFWMETPLVAEPTQGRVEDPATGKSVTVELRPSGGAPGSGSRLSLAAFRLLGADLASLVTLK
ncbi:MAG: D-galactarate dehydratase, partial [Alphaproteobacteria bacterium]